MGFLSNAIKAAQIQAVIQPSASPEQAQPPSGFLGKALANAIASGQLKAVVEGTGAATPAAPATPSTPAVAQGYSVTPQALSIGQTNFRTLPANMLSRLSLASLKDILSMYDKEGEDVKKMAEGGEVQGYADGGFLSVFGQASQQDGPMKAVLGALAAKNPEAAAKLGITPAPTPAPTQAQNAMLGVFSQSPVLGNVLQNLTANNPEAAAKLGITQPPTPAPTQAQNAMLGVFSQSPVLGKVLQNLAASNPEAAKALGISTAGTAGMSATPVATPTAPTEVTPTPTPTPEPTPEPVPVSNAYTVTPQQINIGSTTLMPSADLMEFLRRQRMV